MNQCHFENAKYPQFICPKFDEWLYLFIYLFDAEFFVGDRKWRYPIHLAAALSIHVIALFRPTNPKRFRSYPIDSEYNVVIQAGEKKWFFIIFEKVMNDVL
jgi:hypothetical protein